MNGVGVGMAAGFAGLALVNAHKNDKASGNPYYRSDESDAGVILTFAGFSLASISAIVLDFGIPFSVIGRKRLN